MVYNATAALNDFQDILSDFEVVEVIDNTGGQGQVIELSNGEKVVVFLAPIGYNSSANKRYFDARDSGASKRIVTNQYAIEHRLKYFYLGVRPELYGNEYVFSLECPEGILQQTSGNVGARRGDVGNQINFSRSFQPTGSFERLRTQQGIYISCIHKDNLETYFNMYDNRLMLEILNNEEPLDLQEIEQDVSMGNQVQPNDVGEGQVDLIWNKIYYGAPGTGKSYGVSEEIKSMYPDYIEEEPAEYVVRTSLHPEYTYSDFVGQVMPVKNGEDITYDFKPGVFTNALKKAIELPSRVVYLVLEELSRANVAAVFGDLFQLLDRNDNGISQYKISNPIIAKEIHGNNCENDDIRLPANLLIRGTVNTNDQNVFVMDTAFKRRFEWEYVSTDPVTGANGEFLNNPEIEYQRGSRVSWCDFYQAVNDYITREMELGEDKQIGQFFIKFADQDYSDRNQTLIQNKLLQYLWEDVDKASFNARLFSSAIKNFSTLYKMFESGERVFSTLFLNSLGTPNSNTTPTEADTSETEGESNAEAEE